jgi:hypothetical protein
MDGPAVKTRARPVAGGKECRSYKPLKTIREYFADPSALRNPDDQRIYRLLVGSGWLIPPAEEQLEFNGSCLKETPLARCVHREASAKKRRVKQRL